MPYGKTGSKFDDTLLIEDNLFTAFNRVQEYFVRNLPIISEFKHDQWSRTSRTKYPIDELDEAILNAVLCKSLHNTRLYISCCTQGLYGSLSDTNQCL